MGLYVITGPPAAGKSTWVRGHAKPGDIVIDYDLLAAALTAPGADLNAHPKVLRDVAYRARAAAVTEALNHTNTVDVYVIHSIPSEHARARYEDHDAHIVEIDPGRDVVMQRIRTMRPHAMVAVAQRWYAHRDHTTSTQAQSSRSW
ncbi:ATP-binding protein [Planotetraspora sp. A-T 1434]|uniref:ATP-binding protein n=1 Tax=Planotetraspora sp. A-T 1434 TaxID=2979219 RepID=UPI0021BE3803|nr:ATP-binding protein [Planotetraspora sp. A-T 1434]MCT9932434.1 ATP-binding protein [Planotetraspora sp. A-T 1434]